MSQLERLYRIEQMLRDRSEVTFLQMQETLEVSRATLKRDLAYLRDRLHAPIEYDRFAGAYKLSPAARGQVHQLPGLWFTHEELRALLTMHHLLQQLDTGGLLGPHVRPLIERIQALMGSGPGGVEEVTARVRLIADSQRRQGGLESFEIVANALLLRKRLSFDYQGRHRGELSRRTVSPQRLSHYRDNWYLDAWCHEREALRKFALDAMSGAVMSEQAALDLLLDEVNRELAQGYGIYFGGETRTAVLRFNASAARWVRHEQWHPQQTLREDADGSIEMSLPYLQPTELVMDILRHGENVEVLAPSELRASVVERLAAAARQYIEYVRLTP
jgi:predicted DNA-binding transcriptional regulator YafY